MNCEREFGYPKCMGAAALGRCTCPASAKQRLRTTRALLHACQDALKYLDPRADRGELVDAKDLARRLRSAIKAHDRLHE